MLNTLDDIKNLVSEDLADVQRFISEPIENEISLIGNLCGHLINSGGKRLRPLMMLLSSKACFYTGTKQIGLAAALEYFHTATLLHDDVVDESTLRRGQKTANEIWGSKACILVGDFLFTQSFQWILAARDLNILDVFADIGKNISRGEIKQLALKHRTDVKMEDYFDIIRSKTSLLFSAAAEFGACLSQASSSICVALRNYGLHVGNAFQMIDDALDYCSDKAITGKNIGDDLADGKMTLPLLCAIQRGTSEQIELIQKSIATGSLDYLSNIVNIIEDTKSIDRTYELAREEVSLAISELHELTESPYKQGLIQLAQFAVSRSY